MLKGASMEQYTRGQSSFWADVPHHQFTVARKRTRRTRSLCSNIFGGRSREEVKKRPQRRRRKRKTKKCAYLEQAKSIPFGICRQYLSECQDLKEKNVSQMASNDAPLRKQQQSELADCKERAERTTVQTQHRSHKCAAASMARKHQRHTTNQQPEKEITPVQKQDKCHRQSETYLHGQASLSSQDFYERETQQKFPCHQHSKPRHLVTSIHPQHTDHISLNHRQKPWWQRERLRSHYDQPRPQDTLHVASDSSEDHDMIQFHIEGSEPFSVQLSVPFTGSDIRQAVAEALLLPVNLVHVTVGGHCVTDDVPAGSTLRYFVKGKGGMKGDTQDDARVSRFISRDASEEQVKEWLIQVCGLQQDELAAFDFTDGATLHDFRDHEDLMNTADIGYGQARKIMFLLRHPEVKSRMLEWTCQEVIAFVHQSLKSNMNLPTFSEKCVDGVVFLSFTDASELEKDLGLKGMLARRIIVERGKYLEAEEKDKDEQFLRGETERTGRTDESSARDAGRHTEDTVVDVSAGDAETNKTLLPHHESKAEILESGSPSNENIPPSPTEKEALQSSPFAIPDSLIVASEREGTPDLQRSSEAITDGGPDVQSEAYVTELKEEDELAFYKVFLQDSLHLQPLKPTTSKECKRTIEECHLRIIFNKTKGLNELEASFLFIILCSEYFLKGEKSKAACSKIWDMLTKSIASKWLGSLPNDRRCRFETDEKGNVTHQDKHISFGKEPPKIGLITDRDMKNLQHFASKVLVVDRQLFKDDCQGYSVNLGSKKKPVHYVFGFRKNTKYWAFNPDDFDCGFEETKVPWRQAGSLPRVRFVWESKQYTPPVENKRNALPPAPKPAYLSMDEKIPQTEEMIQQQDSLAADGNEGAGSLSAEHGVPKADLSSFTESDTGQCLDEKTDVMKNTSENLESLSKRENRNSGVNGRDHIRKLVPPRPFKEYDWKYDEGCLRVIETGDGPLRRSTELKYQCGPLPASNEAKFSFLYKAFEFACGCLNSRQNGTIYFGVAEGKVGSKKHDYSQIVGIELDSHTKSIYYDLFQEHLVKCFPKQQEAAKMCVQLSFVLVRSSDPERYVIEVDIEPSSYLCKDWEFLFQPGILFERLVHDPETLKNHVYLKNKSDWTGLFRRDGSATKYITPKDLRAFLKIMSSLIKQREEEEKQEERIRKQLMNDKAADILKRFIGEYDISKLPILVVPKLSSGEKLTDLEHFRFIQHIHWKVVIDFDDESGKDGIHSMVSDNSQNTFDIVEKVATDFRDMSTSERMEELQFHRKTVWLFANGKSTSDNFDRLEHNKWRNVCWTVESHSVL